MSAPSWSLAAPAISAATSARRWPRPAPQPVCFDTLEKGHDWAVRWGPLERGDIGDAARLDEVLRPPPAAAPSSISRATSKSANRCAQPERYLHNNATKTDVLIDAALRHGVEAFVFSSTCAVYGLPQTDCWPRRTASRRSAPMPSPRRGSSARCAAAGARAARRRRCATSTPPAPMPTARSARRTIPRPTCCRSPPTPRSGSAPPSPCWARTIRRPTARASATSCM